MKNNEELKSQITVTLTVQDLQLLETMADNKDIDYIEIDRIINNMFSLDNFNFHIDNNYGETYNQVSENWLFIIRISY